MTPTETPEPFSTGSNHSWRCGPKCAIDHPSDWDGHTTTEPTATELARQAIARADAIEAATDGTLLDILTDLAER